ncbi:NAD(P)H-binding protein [Streptomyces cellostaticus]|uniref:NAD(P)H-binding protein n=1 Tax=Streptomyces cellostaticus TaxID=67285 RepID=UPI0020260118|nr:NAD(P)H-binding protein [Streptomyces cellostaticus]
MILVTGATGAVGGEVARTLVSAGPVRVFCRDPARLPELGPGCEVAVGSYQDRGSLLRALAGVDRAFLVTRDPGGDSDACFLRAAAAAGVRHVVKLSACAAGEDDADDPVTRWQRDCEDLLRSCGLEWTLLRPRAFMSNTLAWAGSIRAEGVVQALHPEAPVACVDPRDVAGVAVAALTSPGHAGRIHTLTGPEAISAVGQTRELSRVLGRPLVCRGLTAEQAAAHWSRRHPPHVVEALLRGAERQSRGRKTAVDPSVARLTGRAARSYARWAADHREAFGAAPARFSGPARV